MMMHSHVISDLTQSVLSAFIQGDFLGFGAGAYNSQYDKRRAGEKIVVWLRETTHRPTLSNITPGDAE